MKNSIPPTLTLRKDEARRFILSHQGLLPPLQWQGTAGILDFVSRVGCIQFDPVNVIERNPELVLQARIADYAPELLDDLLYHQRALVDGLDKVQAIFRVEDWPAFQYRRQLSREHHNQRADLEEEFLAKMLETVRSRGPLSSLDFEKTVKITGYWGAQMHIERYALERLLTLEDLIIHHRVGSRRYYDLAERILPPEIYAAANPFASFEDYRDWHVERRIGGIGLANPAASEFWLAIAGTKATDRWESLRRLAAQGRVLPVAVEGVPERTFFVRATDWQRFSSQPPAAVDCSQCLFLGPLDNFMWDRDLLRWLFDFDYVWEVYKPVTIRTYGPYTLPILLGDRFIGRADMKLERKTHTLIVNNFWWEKGVQTEDAIIQTALRKGLDAFCKFLKAEQIQFRSTPPLEGQEMIL